MNNRADIVTVEQLNTELLDFFGERSLLEEWMVTPLPILEQRQPIELCQTNEGRIRILQIIGEMKHGEMA